PSAMVLAAARAVPTPVTVPRERPMSQVGKPDGEDGARFFLADDFQGLGYGRVHILDGFDDPCKSPARSGRDAGIVGRRIEGHADIRGLSGISVWMTGH